MSKIEGTVNMKDKIGYVVCDVEVMKSTFRSGESQELYHKAHLRFSLRDNSMKFDVELTKIASNRLAMELLEVFYNENPRS